MRDYKEYMIWDGITPKAVTSSTDATPIVVTATSHGFANGDLVMIFGHTTNVAANGTYKVANKAANTFELTNRYTGANIAGSAGGAGASGVAVAAPKIPLVIDASHLELQFTTASSGSMTVKAAGSLGTPDSQYASGTDCPNFGATVSATNPYSFLNLVNLDDNSSLAGSTGIVLTGTDVQRIYEINVNALKYATLIVTAWTAGSIRAKLIAYSQ